MMKTLLLLSVVGGVLGQIPSGESTSLQFRYGAYCMKFEIHTCFNTCKVNYFSIHVRSFISCGSH